MSEESRQIPHSVGCEKSVVSVLMNYPHRADDAPQLTEEHFHLPTTRLFYRHVMAQIRAGNMGELDPVLIFQRMNDAGELDRAGGASMLSELVTYSPVDVHFLNHVQELERFLAYRKTIKCATAMADAAYHLEDSSAILAATSQPITEIQDILTGSSRRTMSKGMVIDEALTAYNARCSGAQTPMGVETSLPAINQSLHGLHPQKTIVISAYPGGGKTTLAAQLSADAALQGARVLMCSLEMPQVDIMNRLLAYVGRQPMDAIIDPLGYARQQMGAKAVTKGMLDKVRKATLALHDAEFEIEDMVGANVHQICATIRRHARKKPLDVVVVDYAQRIRATPDKARESKEQQLSYSSNLLADIAKELRFTLLLPSQLNKQGAAKHAEAINEDADVHLRIIQDDDRTKHLGVLVEKNRGGESGQMLPIVLNGQMIKFEQDDFRG